VPALLARDMSATLSFYERLGFRLTGCDAERATATWAEVARGDIVFQFHTEPPHGTPAEPVCSGTFYVTPVSVGELARACALAGVPFAWGPEVMDYGMNEFAVQDPNGYFIAFSEPMSTEAS
jgi:catechol 2,3-dioxygenase-like lactoylglutathione lyase family enzyme